MTNMANRMLGTIEVSPIGMGIVGLWSSREAV